MKARACLSTIAVGLTLWVSTASAVCPYTRSGPEDGPFVYERDADDCVLDVRPEGVPESRQPVHFNVTCPGRMTIEDAKRVGQMLVADRALKIRTGPPIPGLDPLRSMPRMSIRDIDGYSLSNIRPSFVGIPHLAHHASCTFGPKRRPVVSTDFKVTVKAQPVGPAEIAASCREVNQSGSIAYSARMDREYKCRVHFLASEGSLVPEVTKRLLERDYRDEARRKNLRICALPETSFQCSPCSTTNKLVVRVESIPKDRSCRAGTIASVD